MSDHSDNPGAEPEVRKLLHRINELEQINRLHQMILESAGEGIFGLDMRGNYTFMNKAAAAMLGYEPGELIGKHSHACIHHTRADGTCYPEEECRTYAPFRDGKVRHVDDEVYCRKDGTRFPVEYTSTPVRDDGRIVGAVVTFSDITERKRAEKRLKESERMFKDLAEGSLVGVYLIQNAVFKYVNPRFLEIFGYRHDELIEKNYETVVLSDDIPFIKECMRKRLEGEEEYGHYTFRGLKKGKEVIHAEVFSSATLYQGKPAVIGTLVDVTERIKTQEELKESEWRLEFATSVANEAIWDWDLVTDRLTRNEVYAKTFGTPPERADPAGWWRSRIHPEDRERVQSAFARIFKGEQDDLNVEYRFLLADGTWGIVHDRAKAIRNRQGKTVRLIGTMLNITERKQAENRIRESETNLRTIMDGVYDAVFIHDLDGTILDVNRKMLELYQVGREQALRSRIVEDFSAPDNPFESVPEIWKRAVSGEDQFFEWKALRPNDGSVFDVEVFLRKITFQSRELILANVRDITARKRAEDALRRSETNYREIFESVNDAIFVHDIDTGNVLSVNRKAMEMFGYGQEEFQEFISKSLFTGLPGYTTQDLLQWLRRAAEGPPQIFEWLSQKKNGELFWVEVNLKRAVIGGQTRLLAIVRDINERKRIEEEVKRTKEQLEEAQQIAGFGNWEWDVRTNRLTWSDEVYRIFDIPPDRFKDTFEAVMDMVHPADRAGIEQALAEAANQRKETALNEYRIIRPDDSIRIIQTRLRLEYDSAGAVMVMRGTAQDVTEARRGEEALKLTQFSVDHASVSVFFVGSDARFLYVNEQACRTLGYAREELLSLGVYDIDPKPARSSWDEHWKQTKKERSLRFETVHRKKDGTMIPMEMSVNYTSFAGHEYNVAFGQDISERKRAENSLRQAFTLTKTIIDSMNDAISLIDVRDLTIVDVNRIFLQNYGYSDKSEIVGKRCYEVTHHRSEVCSLPDDICPLVQTVKTKDHFAADHVHYDKRGRKIHVEVSTSPIRDEAGNVTQVVHVQRNITERKRAEEALRESEERFRAFFESAAVGAAEVDPDTRRFLRVNDRLCEITGYSREELTSKTAFDLTHPDDREPDAIQFERAKRGEIREHTIIKRYLHKDGHIVWVDVSGSIIRNRDGAPIRAAGIIQDITARKQTEEALHRSEEFLRRVLDNLIGFVAVLDAGGILLEVNRSALAGAGLRATDVLGKRFEETFWFSWSAEVQSRVREAIRDGALGEQSRFDMVVRVARGALMPVDFMLAPIRDEQGRISHLVLSAIDITDRKRMEDEIRHLAHHDTLTGLPNRRLFNEIAGVELAQAERNKKRFAVLFLDLDRFKEINDTLGHEAGDQLLKEVASRLKAVLRRSDSIGRIGGDEFNIILADLSRTDDVPDVARKLVEAVRKPILLAGHELRVTASIGISIYPDDGTDLDTLLRYSDMAMYHAKEIGRNVYQFYNPSINIRSIERMRLENMLRRSLELGEREVYYQPLINIASGKIICAEALLRWRHPDKGLLTPKDFIATAADTGFIAEIDEWVLWSVARQIRTWMDAGLPPLCVTVNLSARQFQNPQLLSGIETILKETGTPAECIDIEVPESTAMRDVERSAGLMRQLAAMGVHISIDDFGTGYSSLNYLKRMPIEKIKIDRSFIVHITSDHDDRAIIQAVTAMAHSMKIKVIAEGVENREQLSFLKGISCDEAQGFLFSRPVTAERFRELVIEGR